MAAILPSIGSFRKMFGNKKAGSQFGMIQNLICLFKWHISEVM